MSILAFSGIPSLCFILFYCLLLLLFCTVGYILIDLQPSLYNLQPVEQPAASCKRGIKAKFNYASWLGAGSELVRSWFELKFGLSSSLPAAN